MEVINQRMFWLQLKELANSLADGRAQQQTHLTHITALYELVEQQYRRTAWTGEGPEVQMDSWVTNARMAAGRSET